METSYAELHLDPELNHSSGYFTSDTMSLEQAQRAKTDAILSHCRIEPSMKVLDVGCGWGATARAATQRYGAHCIGITLDEGQLAYARQRDAETGGPRIDFRLSSWEEFFEPVDRIVCVNAFENFEDKQGFLPHCRTLLPVGGVMVMLTVTAERRMFRVTSKDEIVQNAQKAGFDVHTSGSLADDYARTLELFVRNLNDNRTTLLSLVSERRLDWHLNYYSKSAEYLRSGLNDMFEFTFTAL
ncbi:class I SAM-dependent methyltransferase [Streptomyces fuscichromogenes]|uniref:Cyclopropane-fatty-acyl-phospholipid synthase n=1 Tax=Streptomyces fuscichromogenes TaxID=1324013 RepID=A0A917UFA1_9ACTN|nr:class I SAM-dependent methyltransferase [Streptomyces fuscichromogenes]GGM88717.1 cyclopropane-fatty-acyl-phospholipid synthase [Streptomyces fuscichromogenes]